jgi:hypothetical protein
MNLKIWNHSLSLLSFYSIILKFTEPWNSKYSQLKYLFYLPLFAPCILHSGVAKPLAPPPPGTAVVAENLQTTHLHLKNKYYLPEVPHSRSQWPRGLRRGSAAARFLGLGVQIPQGAWMSISCKCCVLSDRGLCVGLIPSPEESYRVCVCVCHWVWSGTTATLCT